MSISHDLTAKWRSAIEEIDSGGELGVEIERAVDALQEELDEMTDERDDLKEKLDEAAEQIRDAEK